MVGSKPVYEPAEDSFLLQKIARTYSFGRVLDMGTGSGILALSALENPNVKEVVAVDLNEDAVHALREIITERKLRKIKAIQSDLFQHVEGCFNTILFNPPYLPEDSREDAGSALATTGGKKGWEVSARFFADVSPYLFHEGEILFLFSSLTHKEKIEEILQKNLLVFEEAERLKLSFEELYVYRVRKSPLRQELERKGIEQIQYYTHGWRGDIYTGLVYKNKRVKTHLEMKENVQKVAVKVPRQEHPHLRVENEVLWLEKLNKEDIGPLFLFSGTQYLVYEFVEGTLLPEWLKTAPKKEIQRVFTDILEQCAVMDTLNVNKEELHHPHKHILIDAWSRPILLDFERCHKTEKPHNVTQFVEYLCRIREELKGFGFSVEELRRLAGEYKHSDRKTCEVLLKVIEKVLV